MDKAVPLQLLYRYTKGMANILIIEDEMPLAEAYSFLFRHKGHRVVVAQDGQDGLEKVKKANPHLIIVDMMMPVLDGLGFLKRFDAKKYPDVKILILSNMASRDYEAEAFALGANRYEIKASLSPPMLINVVDELLGS